MANEERVREIARKVVEDWLEQCGPIGAVSRFEKSKLLVDIIARAIAALPVHVPDGWKMVPLEPTEKMREALWYGMFPSDAPPENEAVLIGHAYDAMLAASPPAPASQVLTEEERVNIEEARRYGHNPGVDHNALVRGLVSIIDRLTNKDAEHG